MRAQGVKLTLETHGELVASELAAGASFRSIGRELSCDAGNVQKFARRHGLVQEAVVIKAVKAKITDEVDEDALLQAELAELRTAARKNRKLDIQAERLLAEVRQITPTAVPKYVAPGQAEGEGHHHVHVLMLSDLHVGEVVNLEAMNGLGEYNFEICKERLASIARSLVSYQKARPYPIDELRVYSLGDMTGGKHHQELAETNEFGVMMQAFQAGTLIGQFLESLVEHYPTIHVTGIGGNHARVNPKHQSKQVFDSFDWMANKVSELYLAAYPTITHDYPLSGFHIDHVAGKTILLGHGDGIKSSMPGVPWGGVLRRLAALKATYARVGEHIDYFALGHFHQANVVKGVFMNGSVIGPNEHALKEFGNADPWEQLLLTFDKDAERLTDVSYINGE